MKLNISFKVKDIFVGTHSIWFIDQDDKVYVAGRASKGEMCTGHTSEDIDVPMDITDKIPGKLLYVDAEMNHSLLLV